MERTEPMGDLKNPTIICIKGVLFLVLGVLASALLVLQAPTLTVVGLLVLSVRAFCRSYYFAFYVIGHYVDTSYRFSGLLSFSRYAIGKLREKSRR
jgi:hypothetical protein